MQTTHTTECPECNGWGYHVDHNGYTRDSWNCEDCGGTGLATCCECGETNTQNGMFEFGWKLEGARGDLLCHACWDAEMDEDSGFKFKVFSKPETKKTFASIGSAA